MAHRQPPTRWLSKPTKKHGSNPNACALHALRLQRSSEGGLGDALAVFPLITSLALCVSKAARGCSPSMGVRQKDDADFGAVYECFFRTGTQLVVQTLYFDGDADTKNNKNKFVCP
mgnify:CR=1 FL=1